MKKVLIVDDDQDILDAMTLILQVHNYDVRSARGEREFQELLKRETPDVLLLDMWLSGESGIEICRKIKKGSLSLPVILISASKEVKKSAKIAGADDFLAKPFEMNDLLKKVKIFTSLAKV